MFAISHARCCRPRPLRARIAHPPRLRHRLSRSLLREDSCGLVDESGIAERSQFRHNFRRNRYLSCALVPRPTVAPARVLLSRHRAFRLQNANFTARPVTDHVCINRRAGPSTQHLSGPIPSPSGHNPDLIVVLLDLRRTQTGHTPWDTLL